MSIKPFWIPYTTKEVKNALFSIPGCKVDINYGFGSLLYRDCWDIVGDDIVVVVLNTL